MIRTKILLVDDRRENLVALENIIKTDDVDILKVQSAPDALALLLEHEFALALIDVQMPGMNGFELAQIMRSVDRSRDIPIIFVTASESEKQHIFEGYEHGAVDYLLKPLMAPIVRSKVSVFVDLYQKKVALMQKLKEVETLRDAAESASRAKSNFLANMSHEIRTPLGAVLGFAELLRLKDQSPEERENCINAITRNGQLLLQLLDDILDLSKIEAEKIEVDRVTVSMADLLQDIRAVHEHKASEKGIRLRIETEGRLPREISTDILRLKQILYNIVGNSLKFTERGEICVHVSYNPRRYGGTLLFQVTDTGCGLSDAEAGRIFQPFMQADGSTTRRFGGTGLGLIISKRLAELLGGDVVLVESHSGVGSTFQVSCDPGPIHESQLVDGESLLKKENGRVFGAVDSSLRLDDIRVLVVDDSADNRNLLSRIIGRFGAMVDTASDGSEAVNKALGGNFDVVLMDIQMPGTDGLEATAQLRRQGYNKPILALTAHAMKEEQGRCLNAGCDAHLSKPVNFRSLVTSIAEYAGRHPIQAMG
ncbi:response regulator [Oligoflexus tunisiensis]|uniref:response regulator n=1 Tax=Oligoflexus tunisiensis TaxID=708132 RepID=UPI00159F2FD2|nr:response regulator [Oligoflexus tunisiensis]